MNRESLSEIYAAKRNDEAHSLPLKMLPPKTPITNRDAAEGNESPDKIEMLTVRQVVKRGILPGHAVRELVAQGKIPVVRMGKVAYINYTLLCQQLQTGEGDVWA